MPVYTKLLFFFVLLSYFSCKNNTTTNDETKAAPGFTEKPIVATSPNTPVSNNISAAFICDAPTESQGMEKLQLWLKVGKKKTAVMRLPACASIPKEDFHQYSIPMNALAAGGGWFAGAGDYFYVEPNANGQLNLFQGWVEEEQEGNDHHYKLVMQLDQNGKPLPESDPRRLEATYTLGGHDESWLLIVYPFKGLLKGQFYEIDGMFPPESDIKSIVANAKMIDIGQIELNLYDLTFQSEIGSGFFKRDGAGYSITFNDRKSHIDDVLTLRLNSEYQ